MFYFWTAKIGLNEETFFTSSLARVMYMIETWTKEQETIANATKGPSPQASSPSVPATSIKSVLKGLI